MKGFLCETAPLIGKHRQDAACHTEKGSLREGKGRLHLGCLCLLANGSVNNNPVFTRANKKFLSSHYISIDEYMQCTPVPDENDHHSVCVQ